MTGGGYGDVDQKEGKFYIGAYLQTLGEEIEPDGASREVASDDSASPGETPKILGTSDHLPLIGAKLLDRVASNATRSRRLSYLRRHARGVGQRGRDGGGTARGVGQRRFTWFRLSIPCVLGVSFP